MFVENTVSSCSGGTQSIDGGVIACVAAVSSVATGPPEVNVQMRQEFSHVGPDLIADGRSVATFAVVAGLESVRGQVRMPSFWMRRRLPIGSKSTARLGNKSCVCGVVVVVEHLSCALADPIIIRRCRFRVGSLWFVVTVPMMLFGHHRRHKLACCTCVAFDVVVFLSFCFVHLRREVCVRCEVCFVVVHVRLFWLCFEPIDVF